MTIYVENLPPDMTDDELQALFAGYGAVTSVNIMYDASTGKSKEFGYVEMPDTGEAEAAISALGGNAVRGRTLAVNELRSKPDTSKSSVGSMQ